MAGNKEPRGIRNNNPGNIEYGKFAKSWGATGTDGRFAKFPTPEAGIAALTALQRTYETKYGLTTIRERISRWAPANENNVESYSAAVAREMGISPDTPFRIDDPVLGSKFVTGMIRHENGKQPYSLDQISKGFGQFVAKIGGDAKSAAAAVVANVTAPGKPTPGVLKRGMMNSPAVETLQRQLQQAGFYKGKIDGDFGRQTEKAVRDYQATQGLAVDGKAGPQTLGSLNTVAPVPGASSTYAGDVFGGMPRPPSMPADAFMTAGLPRPPLDPSGMNFANASLGGPSPGPGGAVGADLGAFPYPRTATRPTMVAGRPDVPVGGLPPAPLETMVAGREGFTGIPSGEAIAKPHRSLMPPPIYDPTGGWITNPYSKGLFTIADWLGLGPEPIPEPSREIARPAPGAGSRPVLGPAGDPIARDMAARQQRARDQMAENDAAFAPRPPVPAPDRFTGPGNNTPNTLPVDLAPWEMTPGEVADPLGARLAEARRNLAAIEYGRAQPAATGGAPVTGPQWDAPTYSFGAAEDMGLQRYLAGLGGIPGSLGADPAAANVPPASPAGGAPSTPPPMPPVPGANGNVVLMEGSRISPYAGPFSRAGSALGAAAGSENPYGLQMPPSDYLNLSPNAGLKPMGSLSIPPGGIKVADASGGWPASLLSGAPPPLSTTPGLTPDLMNPALTPGAPSLSAPSLTSPESDYYEEIFGGLDQKGLSTIKLPDPMAPSTQTLKDIGSLLGSAVPAPPTPAQQDYATRKATTATSQALPAGMNFANASLPTPQSSSGGLLGNLSNFWNNAQNTNANWAVPGNWLSPSPLHPAGSPNVWSPWGPAVESGTQAWTDQYNVTHMY